MSAGNPCSSRSANSEKTSADKFTSLALNAIDSIPRNGDRPIFNEPWEAEAFAMVIALYEQGLFTWPEWAETLSAKISLAQANGDPDLGDTYYHHWLAALEKIVVDKGVTSTEHLNRLYNDWDKAARNTPHGKPIVLE